MSNCITSFALKDSPALIERLLPVQRLSAESYKELGCCILPFLTSV